MARTFVKKLIIPAEDVHAIFSNEKVERVIISGFSLKRPSLKKLFDTKGCSCDVCGDTLSHYKILKENGVHSLIPFTKHDVEFTKDHSTPKCAGGSNYISNMIPMCKKCNSAWKSLYDVQMKNRQTLI